MARPSPLPTARPNPFLVARRIIQRQASSATCGWISGDLSKPITCPGEESCLYDTTSLYIAYCCDALAGCSTPTTACLNSSSASSQCGQKSCDPSTLQCTNSDFPFCQTLYWPFSNTLSSFACVSSLTSSFTAYDVYTTTTNEGGFPNVQPGFGPNSGAAVSSTPTSPFSNPTGSARTSSSTSTSQSPTSSPPISTSTSPTSQSPTSTSTAPSSSTPHPLPTSASPFPTSTFDSIKGIAGASLFFLIVISFLLTLILFAIGLLIMLYTRRQERPPPPPPPPVSTTGSDHTSTEEGSRPPTSDSTASTLQNSHVSGQSPEPPSPPPNTHTSPPPETDSGASASTSAPSSNTIRQPSSFSATSRHSSDPAASSAPSGPGPLLQNPNLLGRVGELTSQPSTGMMSDGSGQPEVPPTGLVSLANLHLGTRSKPLPEEPGEVLDGNEREPEHAANGE